MLAAIPCLCFAQSETAKKSYDAKIENSVFYMPDNKGKAIENLLKRNLFEIINSPEAPKEEFWINCGCGGPKIGKSALVLIDGVKGSINDVRVEDVVSFSILKDEKDTAQYGEAGKYGVVSITTKSKEYLKKVQEAEGYDIVVLSPGYEGFLASQQSKEFYTVENLRAKNMQMVNEWNLRHRQPGRYSASIYEVNIDYDSGINYTLDFEYKLHMFFRFMEKEHKMSLIGDRLTAKL